MANSLNGLFEATVNGRTAVVEYEPDTDLRDTEQIPLASRGRHRRLPGKGGPALRAGRLVFTGTDQGRIRDQFHPALLQAETHEDAGGDKGGHPGPGTGVRRAVGGYSDEMNNANTPITTPYPKYKSTDIPGLGAIPEHWNLVRLRQMGNFSKGSGGTKEDEVNQGLPCIRYGDLYTFHKYFISESRSYITPSKAEEYTPIEKGDILFTTSDVTIRNVGKSAVNLLDPPVYCGPDLIILKPAKWVNHRFAGYLFDSPYAQTQKARMQRGVTIMHIYTSQLGDIPFGIPPLDEQAAIVRYLDDADQRIRAYVSTKEKLIALLEEERQAVIHQAVTRGLDPNVRLKPSGVEWLGEVPEQWEVRRGRYLFREIDTRSATGEETHLSMSQKLGLVPSHLVEQSLISDSYAGGKLCEQGDLVLNRLKSSPRCIRSVRTDGGHQSGLLCVQKTSTKQHGVLRESPETPSPAKRITHSIQRDSRGILAPLHGRLLRHSSTYSTRT